MIATLSLATAYFFVPLLSSGKPRNIPLLPALVLRLWLLLSRNYLAALVASGSLCVYCSPTPLHCDSIGALQIVADLVKHELTKHIGVDAHFTRCCVHDQIVSLHYLPSEVQVAVFFTKAQTHN